MVQTAVQGIFPGQLPGPVPNIILIVIITLPLAPQPYPWRQYWPSQWGCFGNRSPDTPEYLVKKVQMRFLLQNWKENVIFHSILVIKLTLNCVSLWFPQQELHLWPPHKECGHYHPSPLGTWVHLIQIWGFQVSVVRKGWFLLTHHMICFSNFTSTNSQQSRQLRPSLELREVVNWTWF